MWENPTKMDDLEVLPFMETPIYLQSIFPVSGPVRCFLVFFYGAIPGGPLMDSTKHGSPGWVPLPSIPQKNIMRGCLKIGYQLHIGSSGPRHHYSMKIATTLELSAIYRISNH